MLYFSDTVCVLTSSESLPALDIDLECESAKGLSNPLESCDSQLDRLDDAADNAGER